MTIELESEWPSPDLPLPLIDYSVAPRYSTLVSPPALIAVIRRARFAMRYAVLQCQWVFNEEQYEIFREFYEDEIDKGAAQFAIELRYPKNTELTEWAVQFAGGFTARRTDGLWQIDGALQLINEVQL